MQNIKNPSTDAFFEAILTLKNVDECYKFFEDVCTVKELASIAQRFTVARGMSPLFRGHLHHQRAAVHGAAAGGCRIARRRTKLQRRLR